MLTRIEIDGFKSFENFSLDLSPFVIILGPNASGKSNLFDAVKFLSNLASGDLQEAVKGSRGETEDVFRHETPGAPSRKMYLAVEVLVEPIIRDQWGRHAELDNTRIRYHIKIERISDEQGIEHLAVIDEGAEPILDSQDNWRKCNDFSDDFRKKYFRYTRRGAWLEIKKMKTNEGEQADYFVRHDIKRRETRLRSDQVLESTVLSSVTTTEDFPHLFALREEMKSWRLLQLDPAALRMPGPIVSPKTLLPDGSNLASVLAKIKAETGDENEPRGLLSDISAEISRLVPGVLGVDVHADDTAYKREYRAFLEMRDNFRYPAGVVSDGTLRVLALLTLFYDPKHRGLVCLEEPENGIHPARLRALIERLSELVTNPELYDNSRNEPLTQLLLNSHSPVALSTLINQVDGGWDTIFFADIVTFVDPESKTSRPKTRMRPVVSSGKQAANGLEKGTYVHDFEVKRYLNTAGQEE